MFYIYELNYSYASDDVYKAKIEKSERSQSQPIAPTPNVTISHDEIDM